MIVIRNLKLKTDYQEKDLKSLICRKLRIKDISSYKILKKSLDSRKHNDIHYQISVGVNLNNEEQVVKKINDNNIMLTVEAKYIFPHILNTEIREFLDIDKSFRPFIIGSGPAGYHAAIKLAKAGFKPVVLERGRDVDTRTEDIKRFWSGTHDSGDTDSTLNPESNVCFGEGGAGTFSDGKLNTGNKDKAGYFKEVLQTFHEFGADESILYESKPHIGSDKLVSIMKNMRQYIERLGGEVRFGHKLTDIHLKRTNSEFGYESELPTYELTIHTDMEEYKTETHTVILAIGHSARDTYKMLVDEDFKLEQKAYAMGVRVIHDAETINKAMYGEDYRLKYKSLPNADYKLVNHTEAGRNVFSFCMCPGGYVVNASSEGGGLHINGMSYSGRNGKYSNSAIVVNVEPEDFDNESYGEYRVLSGAYYQRSLEEKAFKAGKGFIPVQTYGDYISDRDCDDIDNSELMFKGNVSGTDINNLLPEYINTAIKESMPVFGKKINGFDDPDVVIAAVESRTSSPVRITREENMMAPGYPGVFPSGEGAGYAGGITSAGADGIKVAEAVSDYLIEDLIECYKSYETSKYL